MALVWPAAIGGPYNRNWALWRGYGVAGVPSAMFVDGHARWIGEAPITIQCAYNSRFLCRESLRTVGLDWIPLKCRLDSLCTNGWHLRCTIFTLLTFWMSADVDCTLSSMWLYDGAAMLHI